MSLESLRIILDIENRCYWYLYGEDMQTKYCKVTNGFVRFDFDCAGCTMCENKKESV
jgi:hypothetical protein